MCVLDIKHDFKNSLFRVIVYVKYELRFFWVLKFLMFGGQLLGGRCICSVVVCSVFGGQLVGW